MTSATRPLRPIVVVDSVTQLDDAARGAVVIGGSHGAALCAGILVRRSVHGAVLHDARLGRDRAGIAALPLLAAHGIGAACVDGYTARIGDGRDVEARGRVAHVNEVARRAGVEIGVGAGAAATTLARAHEPRPRPGAVNAQLAGPQRRSAGPGARITLLDSISLVDERDAAGIVVAASHGARLAGSGWGRRPRVRVACFHDAGDPDGVGATRLPELDGLGIAGVTVAGASARIGDAESIYRDGVISVANRVACGAGARVGRSLRSWLDMLAAG